MSLRIVGRSLIDQEGEGVELMCTGHMIRDEVAYEAQVPPGASHPVRDLVGQEGLHLCPGPWPQTWPRSLDATGGAPNPAG